MTRLTARHKAQNIKRSKSQYRAIKPQRQPLLPQPQSNQKHYLPQDKLPLVTQYLTGSDINKLRSVNKYLHNTVKPQGLVKKEDYIKVDNTLLLLYNIFDNRFFEEFHGPLTTF